MMKKTNRSMFVSAALALAGTVLLGIGGAQADVKVGVLTCDTVEGSRLNLVIHSTVDVKCVFDDGTTKEHYKGETGIGLGIDLNIKKDATIAFTVLSASEGTAAGSHALVGKYGGAKAAATVGIGAGAAVLVGGGDNSISLQPLALEGSKGLGVEAGLTYLHLEADK